ncbi:polysaccharide deacetylase family protein [Caballeronia turbans]|jgi:peptidoglycan/xylan/chitin deacetylase (PgdA/CDA1 family)|uniref:polysaccharide deacetylase family protein n=1 Tax=unclassified Caballeronia TaxID=2646786 RepID=UPI00074CF3FB|nr:MULTISPECIES: polysaccharide deacetylase family protein [unclassified Caballeronia]SAL23300.1 polysaccharide deacetylase family protein [Caballeronia turbans]
MSAKQARAVPVLMYHHVSTSPGMITVAPENFAAQMDYLASAGYRTIGSAQLAAFLNGDDVPAKSIVITFDDGYLDNWVHAHPVLKRHGFTALCFLVSSWPGEGGVRPNASNAAAALPRLLDHHAGERAIESGNIDDVILRWSEIEAMLGAGTFEFHSHTHTHVRWDRVTTSPDEKRERLQNDLSAARAALRARLGEVSDHLCWPQGYYDDDYREVALSAGFRHFYTCHTGTNVGANPLDRNAFSDAERTIKRLEVRDRPASWLASRLWVHTRPAISRAYLKIKR